MLCDTTAIETRPARRAALAVTTAPKITKKVPRLSALEKAIAAYDAFTPIVVQTRAAHSSADAAWIAAGENDPELKQLAKEEKKALREWHKAMDRHDRLANAVLRARTTSVDEAVRKIEFYTAHHTHPGAEIGEKLEPAFNEAMVQLRRLAPIGPAPDVTRRDVRKAAERAIAQADAPKGSFWAIWKKTYDTTDADLPDDQWTAIMMANDKALFDAPVTDDEALAAKLRFVHYNVTEAGDHRYDGPLLEQIFTALEARAAEAREVADLSAEFERRWQAERQVYLRASYTDEEIEDATEATAAVVRLIEARPSDTLPDIRLKARAIAWAWGGVNLACTPDDQSTASRITAGLLAGLLGYSPEPEGDEGGER